MSEEQIPVAAEPPASKAQRMGYVFRIPGCGCIVAAQVDEPEYAPRAREVQARQGEPRLRSRPFADRGDSRAAVGVALRAHEGWGARATDYWRQRSVASRL